MKIFVSHHSLEKYRPPSMPAITEETVDEILWASFEVSVCQQVQQPPLRSAATTSTDINDAYMIMSGEPPAMPVIPEETEEDLRRENFHVTPLTGKYRPPSMPVITEETHDEILWASFDLPVQQQVQPTVAVLSGGNTNVFSGIERPSF